MNPGKINMTTAAGWYDLASATAKALAGKAETPFTIYAEFVFRISQ
jgi:hypothetical protein